MTLTGLLSGLRIALFLMTVVTSVWVFIDARKRGMWRWTWFLFSLLMWMFGFPAYLLRRYQLDLRSERLGTPKYVAFPRNDPYETNMERVAILSCVVVAVLVSGFMLILLSTMSRIGSRSYSRRPPILQIK
jgi:hypothetical protein